MAEPLSCPHCEKILTDDQVSTLYGRMTNARRKTKSGGKNGGRRRCSICGQSLASPVCTSVSGIHEYRGMMNMRAMAQPIPKPDAEPTMREHSVLGIAADPATIIELTYEPLEDS